MKLKILGVPEVIVEEKEIILSLVEGEDGAVTLAAVTKSGKRVLRGTILTIRPDGTMYRNRALSPNLGFKLDKEEKIVERNS
jgi:hypothetical protein